MRPVEKKGPRKTIARLEAVLPWLQITEEQAQALRNNLKEKCGDAQVYIGMRYWHPFTEEAIAQIKRDGIDDLVILPLYPQFSISTSGSSFRLLEELWENDVDLKRINYTAIPSWYDRPGYVQAMADLLGKEIERCERPEEATVFFSAHGVPQSYVEESGDPYQKEIENCVALIMKALNRPNPHVLAYQSRVGPVEWLKPYTDDVIVELGEQGVKEIVVVPVSFISEHIETLQEIDMEYRELAHESGINNFRRVPALNTNSQFIDDLGNLVKEALEQPALSFAQVMRPQKEFKMYPQERWEWGMTNAAERWNGRLAMIGFLALLLELFMGQGPLHYLGLL